MRSSHHSIKATKSSAVTPLNALKFLSLAAAPLATGAAVVVAAVGLCVELGPVGVTRVILLPVGLPVAVIKLLSPVDPEDTAPDEVAVAKVELPPTVIPLDAALDAEDAAAEAAEDAALVAEETSLEREETTEEMTLEGEARTELVAAEAAEEAEAETEDSALEAEETAEEMRLVGAGMMVKVELPLGAEEMAVEPLSEAMELPVDSALAEAVGIGERDQPVLVPLVTGMGTKLGEKELDAVV
ncbi:MAG: hypothetical protein Q9157_002071 [Trypethelium eluteriae]